MRRPISLVLLILLFISSVPIFVQGEGIGIQGPMVGEPEISLVIDQSEQHVSVEPGDDGVIRFTGTVYCEMNPSTPPGQYCVVQLNADTGGWPVSVPPSMTFDRTHQEEDFSLDIQVPIETSAMTQCQLTVSGRWSNSPGASGGTIPATTALILIEPYSKPRLETHTENSTLPVGKWAEVAIRVWNEGNTADNIELEITNVPDGLDAYLLEDEVYVPEKQAKVVKMKVKQPTGSPEVHRVGLTAKGMHGGKKEMDTHTVVIETGVSAKSFFTTWYLIIPFILIIIGAAFTGFMIYKRKKKVKLTVKA